MNLRHFTQLALVVSLCLSTGCMLSPWDDMKVSDRTEPILFQGYHLQPNQEVQIEAFHHGRGRFQPIGGPVRSSSSSGAGTASDPHRYFDNDIFYWSARRVIPEPYWQPGRVSGHRARVKATTPGSGSRRRSMVTVDRDWSSCYAQNKNAGDFSRNCASDHSPEAWIETPDFCDVQPVLDINVGPRPVRLQARCLDATLLVGYLRGQYEQAQVRLELGDQTRIVSCRLSEPNEANRRFGDQWMRCRIPYTYGWHLEQIRAARKSVRAADSALVREGACNAFTDWIWLPDVSSSYFCPDDDGGDDGAPTPTPTPTGPDLVIEIGEHDGIVAPLRVCNRGNRPVTTNEFRGSIKGSAMPTALEFDLSRHLPPSGLAAGACWNLGNQRVHGSTAGGPPVESLSVTARIDIDGDIDELNEGNNTAIRAKNAP